jgi:hypothetical protein
VSRARRFLPRFAQRNGTPFTRDAVKSLTPSGEWPAFGRSPDCPLAKEKRFAGELDKESPVARWCGNIKLVNEYMTDLASVCTLKEAARLWHVNYWTLRTMCVEGKVASVQPEGGTTWLLSTRHLTFLFGPADVPESPANFFVDMPSPEW